MFKATIAVMAATAAVALGGAASAQSYYGDSNYRTEYRGDYASGSVYGRGSYSSESRQYDSGWRRADGYAPYPSQGYDADYYAYGRVQAPETDVRVYGRTGSHADGYSYDYRYGAPYAQGYAYSDSQPYRHDGGYYRHDRGGRYGYSDRRDHDRSGYRDWYGYNDDRPSSRAVYNARDYYGHDRDCRCSDVYLYDR